MAIHNVTCMKCRSKRSVIRYFAAGERLVSVCEDCWRKMRKVERQAFLASYNAAADKEDTEDMEGENKDGDSSDSE